MINCYSDNERSILLEVADASIKYGLEYGARLPLTIANYPEKLQRERASFVTLEINHTLRGCIGTLCAHQPLVLDVAHNAYCAAFCDPRFCPLTIEEYPTITKHISVLSIPEPMHFDSEEDLLRQLRPGIDGLVLNEQGYCGTFLPSVWECLPEPREFLQHLKVKAGLPPTYWSDTIKIERYVTEVIE